MATGSFTKYISASGNDGYARAYRWSTGGSEPVYYWSNTFNSSDSTTAIGYRKDGTIVPVNYYWSFFRFTSLTIPEGATITAANLHLNIYAIELGGAKGYLYGNDVDDAVAPTTHDGVKNLTTTTASVDLTSNLASTGWKSLDVTSIVQEIVSRGGWSSGNDLQFKTVYASTNGVSWAYTYNNGSNIPYLQVAYEYVTPLNSSGQLSLGGTTTGQSFNLRLEKSATAQISMNDTDVRALIGKASGAQNSMSEYYGA